MFAAAGVKKFRSGNRPEKRNFPWKAMPAAQFYSTSSHMCDMGSEDLFSSRWFTF